MKKYKLWTYIGMVVLIGVYMFIEVPNLNPLFFDGAVFWAVIITGFVAVWGMFRFGEIIIQLNPDVSQGERPVNYVSRRKFPKWTKFLLAAPWIFIVLTLIFSSVFIQWKTYRDQLGTSQVMEFASDMQAVDLRQVPVVDKELALNLADKKLGERPSLGSQVVKGEATIQRVNDKLVWVVPLQHSGVFKWLTNLSGTPGYVMVSATDVNDVEYVENFKIKYQENSYLLHDITRHVRFHGGWFTGIADPSFELDDNGQPYWVYTTYKNLRGFSLPEATGAYVVNATTGEMNRYTIDTIPEWVDRIQPESFIINQIDNKGEYVRGWLNFADKDKFRSSEGHMIVYNNGRCYLFTGMTSVGSDDSAIGFIMVDMVTKDSMVYQMSGATERAAQQSAEGKVQHLGYRATFPLIINLGNEPTYFMALKDKEGLIKQYAFVSVTNYSIVGTGETIQLAEQDYRLGLKSAGISAGIADTSTQTKAQGVVLRIASEILGGDTEYKIILENQQDKIYLLGAVLSDELALTQVGDKVVIEYMDSGDGVLQAVSFDNLSFSQN